MQMNGESLGLSSIWLPNQMDHVLKEDWDASWVHWAGLVKTLLVPALLCPLLRGTGLASLWFFADQ